MRDIINLASELAEKINDLPSIDDKINALNNVRLVLHNISPEKYHPVDCVLWKKTESIHKNSWNPNHVAPPENKLLHTSMLVDGITMPTYTNPEQEDKFETIDGHHRTQHIKNSTDILKLTYGYVPITIAREENRSLSSKMASTIRHNRARGTHEIDLMVNLVAELVKAGMSDAWIAKNIGMDADELLRLKQISGLAELFKDKEFSKAKDEQ